MPIPSLITDLSTTAASNSPAGSENVFPDLDGFIRAYGAFIASLNDLKAPKASPTFTGVVSLADGTATAPALTFSSDTNTGMYRIGADQIGWTTAGVLRMSVDSSGNFSLGNTSIPVRMVVDRLSNSTHPASYTAGTTASFIATTAAGSPSYIALIAGASAVSGINLGDTDADFRGRVAYDNSTDTLSFSAGAATALSITSGGLIYGASIHNNATSPTGATNGYLASGTYTPTLTNVANVSASTAFACQWIRVGNVVTVSGGVSINPNLSAAQTTLGMSLPIPSNFTSISNLGGAAACGLTGAGNVPVIEINADTVNDRASFNFQTTADTNNNACSFTFTYVVL